MKSEPIEIAKVNPQNLLAALDLVRGYWKATTILWMHAMGLPVLSGVIADGWSRRTTRVIGTFCHKKGISELLLRIDKCGERWTKRRGGYLLPLARVPQVVEELSRDEMIAILLEPASPYADYYSLGAIIIPDERKIVIEVVGPGFDASDILRGDLQPHERFEVLLRRDGHGLKASEVSAYKHTFLIDPVSYQKTVERRLAKIGARLENPAFPDSLLHASRTDHARLVDKAKAFLKGGRQTLLLQHMEDYTPIPSKCLGKFISGVSDLLDALAGYGIHLGATSISASFLADRGLIFWDFFPAKMRDTAALTPKTPDTSRSNAVPRN